MHRKRGTTTEYKSRVAALSGGSSLCVDARPPTGGARCHSLAWSTPWIQGCLQVCTVSANRGIFSQLGADFNIVGSSADVLHRLQSTSLLWGQSQIHIYRIFSSFAALTHLHHQGFSRSVGYFGEEPPGTPHVCKPQTSAAARLIQSLFLRPTFSSRGVSNNSCERRR